MAEWIKAPGLKPGAGEKSARSSNLLLPATNLFRTPERSTMSIDVTRVTYSYNDPLANSMPKELAQFLSDKSGDFYRVVDRPAGGRTNLENHIGDYLGFCSPREARDAATWGKEVSYQVRAGTEVTFRFDE